MTPKQPYRAQPAPKKTVWAWLFEPSPAIRDKVKRKNARLLSALLFGLSLSTLINVSYVALFTDSPRLSVFAATALILSAGYGLSRTRLYALSTILTLTFLIAPTVMSTGMETDMTEPSIRSHLVWLALPVIVGGVFFSIRGTAIFSLVLLAGIPLLPLVIPGLPFQSVVGGWGFVFTTSALTVTILYHRNQLERDRQAQLRESEYRYRALFEHTNDAVFILSLEGTHLAVNQQAVRLLGYMVDELIDMPMKQIVISEEYSDSTDKHRRLLAGEQLGVYTRLFRHKDGHAVPVEINAALIRDPEGRPMHIQSIVRDISERKRVEHQIRQSEEKFRTFVEQSTDGLALVDEQGTIIEWNYAQAKMTGITRQEAIGKPLWDVQLLMAHPQALPPGYQDQLKQVILSALETGSALFVGRVQEVKMRRQDGTEIFIQQTPFTIKTDQGYRIGSISRDVTDHRQIEEALRERERLLQAILAATPIGLAHVQNHTLSWANEAMCQILGWTPEEFLHTNVRAIYPDDQEYERAGRDMYAHFVETGSGQTEARLLRKDNTVMPCIVGIRALDPDAPARGHIISITDITERKRTEETVARRAREMAALNQVTYDIVALQDLDLLLRRIVENAVDLTGRPGGGISLHRPDSKCLEWVVNVGEQLAPIGFSQCQGDGLVGRVWATRQTQIVNSYQEWDGRSPHRADLSASVIGVPIQYGDEFLGVLVIADPTRSPFDDQDVEILGQFAAQSAIAIQNVHLYEQAQQEIAERKRVEATLSASLHLFQAMEPLSIPDIIQSGLEEGVRLTASEIGFFHFVNPDQKTIRLQTWSKDTLKRCTVSEMDTHYLIEQAGVWVDCIHQRRPIIHNDYPSLPHKKGLPEGHTPLIREMVVPLFEQDNIVAVIGVGNKAQDYTQFDIDQLTLLATNAWNIIQQKRAEAARRESEQLLRLVFESAFDGISVYEEFPEGRPRKLLDCNARYAEIAGRSKEELLHIGNTLPLQTTLEHRIDPDRMGQLNGVETYRGRFSWHRLDGQENMVEYAAVRIRVQDRTLVIGVDRDITQQMHAAQEREALIDELESKNAELERFVYTVSHDLKSPLITIKGFLGFLEQDILAGNAGQIKNDFSRISTAADRMQQLLDELLELSRIGRISNPIQEISLTALTQEVVEIVAGQLIERGVQVDIASDLPIVYGDRPRLSEVLQNLIDNAVKYMGNQSHPRIEIGTEQTGRGLATFVRDNGIGIEPRYHDTVFGLFEKLDPNSDGTGIGLAIVKRIVETHGGQIWVESEGSGKGSTFYFTLAHTPPEHIRRTKP
ncbi:MAG: PAS domain S-box protein [Anaerolineae bacterium]|nr:PAS domain S-box protein [Anaerolineae bacterium]